MNIRPFFPNDLVVFTTQDYAYAQQTSISSASRQLQRLRNDKIIIQLTRGVWANPKHPHFNIYACVPKLLGNEQGYISFLTALHLHGALSQIPTTVQIATTGHGRILQTPVTTFEFFQLKPALFTSGIDQSETRIPYFMATVEKALFDTLYLATRKGKRFLKRPELSLDDAEFSIKKMIRLIDATSISPQIRIAIRTQLDLLFEPEFVRHIG